MAPPFLGCFLSDPFEKTTFDLGTLDSGERSLPFRLLMCVSGFSSEKTRYGPSALSFYFIEIFYMNICIFSTFPNPTPHSPPFFSIFDNILLTISN